MYCTKADMVLRFGEDELIQRTDRLNNGIIDDAVLDQAISDATAEINSYIINHLPLPAVPAVLVRHCCDIARYFLYANKMVETVQERYDAIIAYLVQVAKGNIGLGADASSQPMPNPSGSVISSSPPVFGDAQW